MGASEHNERSVQASRGNVVAATAASKHVVHLEMHARVNGDQHEHKQVQEYRGAEGEDNLRTQCPLQSHRAVGNKYGDLREQRVHHLRRKLVVGQLRRHG